MLTSLFYSLKLDYDSWIVCLVVFCFQNDNFILLCKIDSASLGDNLLYLFDLFCYFCTRIVTMLYNIVTEHKLNKEECYYDEKIEFDSVMPGNGDRNTRGSDYKSNRECYF